MDLDLTRNERLMLANQYAILAKLDDDPDYARLATALREGHKYLYSQILDQISEDLPKSKEELVLSILGIYGDLNASYKQLVDKTGIEENDTIFPGFDGNNEGDLLSFSDALTKNGQFDETIGPRGKNSHFPTVDGYRRMIRKAEILGKPLYPYAKDVIEQIIHARRHPDAVE